MTVNKAVKTFTYEGLAGSSVSGRLISWLIGEPLCPVDRVGHYPAVAPLIKKPNFMLEIKLYFG